MDIRTAHIAMATLAVCAAWVVHPGWMTHAAAQPADAPWLSEHLGTYDPAWQAGPGVPAGFSSSAELSQLSTEELIELYMTTYQESLRRQVADQAALVEPGRFLLQTGYTFSRYEQEQLRRTTHTVPSLMLRYRVLPRCELRVAWGGVVWDGLTDSASGVSDWETRLSDPSVGARLLLWSQRAALPRATLTVSSPLNVDSDVSLVNRLDPFVGIGYSWELPKQWLVSGTSAMVWTREEDDRYLDFQQSITVDWLMTKRWGVFVEWSGLFPEGGRTDAMRHALGPGISCSLHRNVQVDVVTMFGLDSRSPDLLTQLLLSWRF